MAEQQAGDLTTAALLIKHFQRCEDRKDKQKKECCDRILDLLFVGQPYEIGCNKFTLIPVRYLFPNSTSNSSELLAILKEVLVKVNDNASDSPTTSCPYVLIAGKNIHECGSESAAVSNECFEVGLFENKKGALFQ